MKFAAPKVPEWMNPSECRIMTRKYGSTRLSVVMNTSRAEKTVLYSLDGEDWDVTTFQTADFRHRLNSNAMTRIWHWI